MTLRITPIIGITMGDAAGIGPEIIAKALSSERIYDICRPIVIGDANIINEGMKVAHARLKTNRIASISHAKFTYGVVDVFDLHNIELKKLKMGQPQAMCGKASVEYITKAVEMAMKGEIHAITTAPISKEAINMADYRYAGHTEILAHLTKTKDYAMMLVAGSLRVIHVTTHIPLYRVSELIKKDRLVSTIELAFSTLRGLGFKNPRIAVAGLNPHAGENGLLGREELDEIKPAIELARERGIDAVGPIPADTVFVRTRGGEFDIVVVMYHDQGHIPIKLLGFEFDEDTKKWKAVGGVNVTIGLPIIRTSVDHGTAYGKAGKKEGTANPQSLIEAIKLAAEMASEKFKTSEGISRAE
jgi:4-hydroxythreonine-4-phosphate dehydrogenase